MNVIKLILIIAAILGIAALGAMPTLADTITWNRDGGTNDWHTGANWDSDEVPGASDDVVIPKNTPTAYLVVISSQDAACKTLDIEATSRLEIKAKTLTLGDSGANTTSTLDAGTGGDADGTIRLVRVGLNYATLAVHKWVTFTGGGTIDAPTSSDGGIIKRASGSDGIVISAGTTDNAVIGNITLLCDVDNDGTRFGVETGQTMVFGDSAGNSEPEISGSGEFYTQEMIRFTIVTFAQSAPKWVIRDGEIHVTDDAGSTYWVNLPFDIDMVENKQGTLDLDHDFICLGTLNVKTIGDATHTIEVAAGKVAVFNSQYVP